MGSACFTPSENNETITYSSSIETVLAYIKNNENENYIAVTLSDKDSGENSECFLNLGYLLANKSKEVEINNYDITFTLENNNRQCSTIALRSISVKLENYNSYDSIK